MEEVTLSDLIRREQHGKHKNSRLVESSRSSNHGRPIASMAEEALTRRDVRAAREMKKSGWANWCGAREDSGIKGGLGRLKGPL